jgi:hypothetical protein
MPSQKNTKVNKPTAILSIMALLALWLVGLLVLAGWYQSNYIQTITQTSPEF